MKLNSENIIDFLKSAKEYIFPIERLLANLAALVQRKDLKNFIQERSAHVTQTTLYGYLKLEWVISFAIMVQDEEFSKSINLAKWNIYMVALADCTFFVFSYLISEKNLQKQIFNEIFLNIIDSEKKNGLSEEIYIKAKKEFLRRAETVDFKKYYLEEPFKESGLALFYWSPIADELKDLDKKIVLNSIKLKWNLVSEEFKKMTKDLKFN